MQAQRGKKDKSMDREEQDIYTESWGNQYRICGMWEIGHNNDSWILAVEWK